MIKKCNLSSDLASKEKQKELLSCCRSAVYHALLIIKQQAHIIDHNPPRPRFAKDTTPYRYVNQHDYMYKASTYSTMCTTAQQSLELTDM